MLGARSKSHRARRPGPCALRGVALFLLSLLHATSMLACNSVPVGKHHVASVDIIGAKGVEEEELKERIATIETPKLFGIFYGVYEYEVFDRHALSRDLARIERAMHARGYYEAKVHVARVEASGDRVQVSIEVAQGPVTTVESISLSGGESLGEAARSHLAAEFRRVLPEGAPLDEDKLDEAELAGVKALTARGHAIGKLTRHVEVDLATASARIDVKVSPGPLARIGAVTFEGLDELPESTVRRVFGVEDGDVYSSEEIAEGRQALLDLGVLASIDVTPDLSAMGKTNVVPLHVKCEVAKLRAILLGGGFEFDSLKTDLHLLTGWQSSNWLGGLRRFEIRAKPGIVLYPTRFPDIAAPDELLPETRISASLKQPAMLEKRTTGLTRAEYNAYPVLLPGNTSPNVLGYHELRGSIGAERTFWAKLFVSPTYGVQANFPFDYLGKNDAQNLIISYVDIFTTLDFRDDPLKTKKGIYLGNQLQLAGGALGGDATDLRVQPEIRGYVPISRRVVLAARASVGFLFASDYGRRAEINFRNEGPSRLEESDRDYQILFFRGFYAGGPTSNRGYPLRGIGPYDRIPYLSPAGQSLSASGCNPNDSACSLPTGGPSLWEMSLEARIVISGPFSTALFCDAADVSPFRFDIRLDRPHLSCGAGGRYDTPVGPIRLDIGYRVPGLQFPTGASFERPPEDFLGIPIALAFGIGEAF